MVDKKVSNDLEWILEEKGVFTQSWYPMEEFLDLPPWQCNNIWLIYRACRNKCRSGPYPWTTHMNCTEQCNTVQYSTVQYSTVQYSTVQYSTVQYSTVQYSTVQYSTVQYSTVQYSTVQYNTVQYSTGTQDWAQYWPISKG